MDISMDKSMDISTDKSMDIFMDISIDIMLAHLLIKLTTLYVLFLTL